MIAAILRRLFPAKSIAGIMAPLTKIHEALHAMHVAAEADVEAAQAALDAAKAVSLEAQQAKAALSNILSQKEPAVG